MSNTASQLALCEAILALIEQARTQTGDPFLGSNIERVVLDSQFQELEREIMDDPGAFEPWLIRRRKGEA